MSNKIKVRVTEVRHLEVELDPTHYPEDSRSPEAMMAIEKANAVDYPEYFDGMGGSGVTSEITVERIDE